MNFTNQPQQTYTSASFMDTKGMPFTPSIHNQQFASHNENQKWVEQAIPQSNRYLPSAQGPRQFGKELQNIPTFRETVHQADQMEVDEGNTFRAGACPGVSNQIQEKHLNQQSLVEYEYQCDRDNASNTQYCSEYAVNIHQYLLRLDKQQRVDKDYMSRQTEINDKMRAILVDWLIEVHLKFRLQRETLYITVKIIDLYLEKQMVTKSRLQLVGVTSLLIASKYEEIYPPELKDFVFITDKAYTKDDVLQMEFSILNTLSFELTFPTSNRFLERFMKLLGDDQDVMNFAQFLIELGLIDIRMIQYSQSIIAASAICLAYKIMYQPMNSAQQEAQVDQKIERYIANSLGFNESDVLLCIKELEFIKVRSMSSSLQSVIKKYSSPQFKNVQRFIYQQN
eukprot:403371732